MLDIHELKGWTKQLHEDRLREGKLELVSKDGRLRLFRFVN